MKNDNFNQQTRVDRPTVLGGVETCRLRDSGSGVVRPANRSGRFTVCRSTCRSTTPACHPNSKGVDKNVRERNVLGSAEMTAAKTLTTRVLAIGTWTAKATPKTIPPVMPSEAYDTMRLMLAGKIDQWFAKIDGSGAVFLMNVTDPAEAHALLEKLPLGQADMMTFQLIPVGPLWPLGLLQPAK
jgi:hypothetical protein